MPVIYDVKVYRQPMLNGIFLCRKVVMIQKLTNGGPRSLRIMYRDIASGLGGDVKQEFKNKHDSN